MITDKIVTISHNTNTTRIAEHIVASQLSNLIYKAERILGRSRVVDVLSLESAIKRRNISVDINTAATQCFNSIEQIIFTPKIINEVIEKSKQVHTQLISNLIDGDVLDASDPRAITLFLKKYVSDVFFQNLKTLSQTRILPIALIAGAFFGSIFYNNKN